jgi:hypothetical protein
VGVRGTGVPQPQQGAAQALHRLWRQVSRAWRQLKQRRSVCAFRQGMTDNPPLHPPPSCLQLLCEAEGAPRGRPAQRAAAGRQEVMATLQQRPPPSALKHPEATPAPLILLSSVAHPACHTAAAGLRPAQRRPGAFPALSWMYCCRHTASCSRHGHRVRKDSCLFTCTPAGSCARLG